MNRRETIGSPFCDESVMYSINIIAHFRLFVQSHTKHLLHLMTFQKNGAIQLRGGAGYDQIMPLVEEAGASYRS
jgi:hypothetical protein